MGYKKKQKIKNLIECNNIILIVKLNINILKDKMIMKMMNK